MLRMKYVGVTILSLSVWAGSLPAQTGARKPSPGSTVVVRSGSYQLTEQMLEQALRFGQILAGAGFSPSDAAALRADLIADFPKQPAKEVEGYETTAKELQGLYSQTTGMSSWLNLALARYRTWQSWGENPQAFGDFQNATFGKTVLKYNPVLVNSGGRIVTKTDVDCQFYSDVLVAKAAGFALPTRADEDRFIKSLPSRFGSLPTEQKEYLRRAELRLVDFNQVYNGTIRTRAVVAADIKKNVHSSADVWREARQVENDAAYGSRYYELYRDEAVGAVLHANGVAMSLYTLGSEFDQSMRKMQEFSK